MANDLRNETLLAVLYRENRRGLFALAMAITRSREAAEDAIHEAFSRLCRRRLEASDPKAYVFAAVRNAARDQSARRRNVDLPLDLMDRDRLPEQTAEANEMADLMQNCLASLDDVQRDAVVMRIWGQLTFEQIAGITGEPLQTVASRYRRAILRLKELMGNRV